MHDTYVTVIGNVVSEPSLKTTGGGLPVLNLRVASTPRHFDATTGEWRDRETTFLSVTCWRALAENVSRSVHRGDAVVVHGKLLQRSYETGHGERRTSTEVEAATVGHDLARGTAAFARAGRASREAAPAPRRPLPGDDAAGLRGDVPAERAAVGVGGGAPGEPGAGSPAGVPLGEEDPIGLTSADLDLLDGDAGEDPWSPREPDRSEPARSLSTGA